MYDKAGMTEMAYANAPSGYEDPGSVQLCMLGISPKYERLGLANYIIRDG